MKMVMHIKVLQTLVLNIIFLIVKIHAEEELKLCSEPVSKIQLCKKEKDYVANKPPIVLSVTDPKPLTLAPILNLHNVLEIDHDEKSITLYFTIDMEWIDSEIGVSTPEGVSTSDYEWFHIYKADDVDNVWTPELTFPNIIDSKMLNNYGRGQKEFDLWYGTKSETMQFIKSMKLRLACPFNFENYPFDSHRCDFDFASAGYGNVSVTFAPVKILTPDSGISKPEILDKIKETVIPNSHLPYSFTMIGKDSYIKPVYTYWQENIGIIIHIKRSEFGQLIGGFFGPMNLFSFLSTISFFINPDVVPGRMGLLVTLHLISSNVYSTLHAPIKRGFSYIEIFMIGTQAVIFFSLLEYGLVLAWKRYPNLWKKYQSTGVAGANSNQKKEGVCGPWFGPHVTQDAKIKHIDIISFIISVTFLFLFNIIYWTHVFFLSQN